MKSVYLRYNPFRLKADIWVDGRPIPEDARLRDRTTQGHRLQGWLDDFPRLLVEDLNDQDFTVTFHGPRLAYDDVADIVRRCEGPGGPRIELRYEPVMYAEGKLDAVEALRSRVRRVDLDDDARDRIEVAVDEALSDECRVVVVATMKSGKSTLLNALIGRDLLPSRARACTATITRIKDVDGAEFSGTAFGLEDGTAHAILDPDGPMSLERMERLNGDEMVGKIEVRGDIPFLRSNTVKLVFVDTPGPDNARDGRHRLIQERFLQQGSQDLVLFIVPPAFGTKGMVETFTRIAEITERGGLDARDRFFFICSRMDDRDPDKDGSAEETLAEVAEHLGELGIREPNLFPSAALPALRILRAAAGDQLSQRERQSVRDAVRVFNEDESFHLEKAARVRRAIKDSVPENARSLVDALWATRGAEPISQGVDWHAGGIDCTREEMVAALIHTGIPTIQAAIREYSERYLVSLKVNKVASASRDALALEQRSEEARRGLLQGAAELEVLRAQMTALRRNLEDGERARRFRAEIDKRIRGAQASVKGEVDRVHTSFERELRALHKGMPSGFIAYEDIPGAIRGLNRSAERVEAKFHGQLERVLAATLDECKDGLVGEYRRELASLVSEVSGGVLSFDPFELVAPGAGQIEGSWESFVTSRTVTVGYKKVPKPNKRWWNPFDWGATVKVPIREIERGIQAPALFDAKVEPIERHLRNNVKNAQKYLRDQFSHMQGHFGGWADNLDRTLLDKVRLLEKATADEPRLMQEIERARAQIALYQSLQAEVAALDAMCDCELRGSGDASSNKPPVHEVQREGAPT